MPRSFITVVRVGTFVLFQYIDTETDVVTFCEDLPSDEQVARFTMDFNCETRCIDGKGEALRLGKFRYGGGNPWSCNSIQFEFDKVFLFKNPRLTITDITFNTNDFIKAEERLVQMLLTLYPSVFIPPQDQEGNPCQAKPTPVSAAETLQKPS